MKKALRRFWRPENRTRTGGSRQRISARSSSLGYTLIELLLYVSIVGGLMSAVTMYFVTSAESRVKNQSIVEVNQQAALIMERITQSIRNADSITSPAAGASAASLTVTTSGVQTIFDTGGATHILGYNGTGTATDDANRNIVNSTKFVASATGTITTLYARVASPIGSNPNNKARMAIYSGTNNPTTLLGSSGEVTLTGDAWNAFSISSVNVTSGQTYWLAYNTNGATDAQNNLRRRAGTTGQSMWINWAYGTWPASFNANTQDHEFSMYAEIVVGGTGTVIRVKEGAASPISLNNDKVEISNLTFTNMTRSGTPGTVRVSFTLSRANPNARNEYSYQKTFISSASLR